MSFLLGLGVGRWGVLAVLVVVLSGLAGSRSSTMAATAGVDFGVASNLFVAGVTLVTGAAGVALRRWADPRISLHVDDQWSNFPTALTLTPVPGG
jgi:nitrate reductase gamma subunit